MAQDRLKVVLAAGMNSRNIMPASATDARFAQAAREVLLKHRAAQGFRDPPPKGPLVAGCCSEKKKGCEDHEEVEAMPTGDTKCCDHPKEGPEFRALQQRVEQLEMLVRFLLSQPSRPYPVPFGLQMTAANAPERPVSPVERSVSRR